MMLRVIGREPDCFTCLSHSSLSQPSFTLYTIIEWTDGWDFGIFSRSYPHANRGNYAERVKTGSCPRTVLESRRESTRELAGFLRSSFALQQAGAIYGQGIQLPSAFASPG
ncbi:hypothetical protein NPIL_67891 [Nephila pilipes]|uniref:Uncharacterized protein n=1 Tax=Nephila pilipes TaxID=299642 RepID=A0A8X6PIG5_NEPPI|nr:hypothetical protein NPIL_67891 [Nephila pilipes]